MSSSPDLVTVDVGEDTFDPTVPAPMTNVGGRQRATSNADVATTISEPSRLRWRANEIA